MIRFIMAVTVLLLGMGTADAAGGILPKMRISVENTDTHFHTHAVRRFADILRQKLDGRIDVQFFSTAQLFRDADVIQALGQGKVEMAVPGTWHVMQYEPDVGVFMLPVFYGRSARENHRILDSPIGRNINEKIESSLKLKVLGGWIDLGYAHLFGVHQNIEQYEDIKGLRIRVAGGIANKLRIQGLGGNPMIIPWPDLSEHIMQDKVDGILTTYETVKSAKLWEAGIQSVFEDRQYFPQYIPLVRASFWERLPLDIQETMMETWKQNIVDSRMLAAASQKQAKETLVKNKVAVFIPEPEKTELWRNKLLLLQDGFVQQLGIDPELVRQIQQFF
jgi:TRAP-type C4-dicarboxylate transport system substrate-binding protein